MSTYGKIPELMEEVEYLVGKRDVKAVFHVMLMEMWASGEHWLDNLGSEEDISKCFEFRRIVHEGLNRFGLLSSTGCVTVIKAWRVLDKPEPIKEMSMLLIGMVQEPITALALVGEFTT